MQLAIDLPPATALGREDLVVHGGNAAAVALIDRWPDWPGRILALAGPAGAGKTHLAAVWRAAAGAARVAAERLDLAAVPALAARPLLIEDADGIGDEEALLHLINQVREVGGGMLLTARAAPSRWPVQLADLKSRLSAMPLATLTMVEEADLSALMRKLLADRQLALDPQLTDWAVTRIERTPQAVRRLVEELDRRSLALGLKIGPRLLRQIVGEVGHS